MIPINRTRLVRQRSRYSSCTTCFCCARPDQGKEVNKTSAIYKDLNDVAFRNIALGQNYFETIGREHRHPKRRAHWRESTKCPSLSPPVEVGCAGLNFTAPKICPSATAPAAPTAMLQQDMLQGCGVSLGARFEPV